MNRQHVLRIASLTLAVVAAGAFEARAQAPQPPQAQVRMTLFYSPATTVLKAPALAGRPEFENDGEYFGLMAQARYGRFSLNGFYQGGKSDDIEGGADFTAPTFNPLTYEKSNQIDVSLGYAVLENNPWVGTLDATVGYYRLWAGPKISPANWYKGLEFGLQGRREFPSKWAVVYKAGFVPDYSVHGYMDGNLEAGNDGNIQIYRIGLEYPIAENFLLTGGFQRVRLEGNAVADGSTAIVTLSGFYYGLVLTF